VEEPFWPPDENVTGSREDRGAPAPVVHGEPVAIDPTTATFVPTRPRDEQVGSPWNQPPVGAPGEPGPDAGAPAGGPDTAAPAVVPPGAGAPAIAPPMSWPVRPAHGNGGPPAASGPAAPAVPHDGWSPHEVTSPPGVHRATEPPPAAAVADPGTPAGNPKVRFEPGIYRPADPPPAPGSGPEPVSVQPAPGPQGTPPPPPPPPPPPVGPAPEARPPYPAWNPAGAPNPHHQPGQVYRQPVPPQQYTPAPGVYQAPPAAPVPPDWTPDAAVPTAEDFARRRAVRPADPVATMGMRGLVRKSTLGLVSPGPGRREQEFRHDIEMVRRNFGGLRQVTVVNPKGGAGKTMAVLLLAMTFGQRRGGYVLAWDNNETQGTLGMRAQQDFHSRTVRDLLRDLDHFRGTHGRVGDLSQYVRAQAEGMFDVLASDESATAGEMLTALAFADIREIVSRFYKLIFVDTGNNVRAENWQAAIDATDQLVVTMSARNDSAETAARMLDYLEQQGLHRLVRQAVSVVSMPPSRRELDIPAIIQHFAARTRTVLLAPYERVIDSGEPLRYNALSSSTRMAWLKIAAAVAEGL
jgi:MinD-like ATPase involved in chromosome partitioning or flagellar assembly